MSEEQSPAENIKFRIRYWRNLFLVTVFSCFIVAFGFWLLGEIFEVRETQVIEPQPTQKLFSSAPELGEETPTLHTVNRQETLSDGSTRIVDLEVGYELILPPDWQLIPIDEELYNEWKASYIEEQPEAVEWIEAGSKIFKEGASVFAFSFDPYQSIDEHFSILVTFFQNFPEIKDIPLEPFLTNFIEEAMEINPYSTFYQPECKRNFNSVDYCEVMADFNNIIEGEIFKFRALYIYIKAENGLFVITLGAPLPIYPDFVDIFDEIINSIKLND